MSGAVLSLRRSHRDHVRRSAAWLVALAIFVQCVFGSAAMLRMWAGDLDPLGVAPALCIDQGAGTNTPDRQDQGPIRALHDHEHCLLCNGGLITATLPAPAVLPLPLGVGAPLPAAPQVTAGSKESSRPRSRGPPALA